jgi:4-hydroxy 2-oxovalerate aldolase
VIAKDRQEQVLSWNKKIDWGYPIPYLITGALNTHPRNAISWMESEKKDDFVAFMKKMHDYELPEQVMQQGA